MSKFSLTTYLVAYRSWFRLRDGLILAQRTLWMALVGIVVILIISRYIPLKTRTLWIFMPLAVWLCANTVNSLFNSKRLNDTARLVDLELRLKERLSTAYELENKYPNQISSQPVNQPSNLPSFQYNDALATAANIEPRHAFPLRWLYRPILGSVGLLIAVLILLYLPNPMDTVLAERAAVEKAAQEQAEKVEDLKEGIERSQELTPELRAELLLKLEELSLKLRENPGDRQKALVDISKMEDELRRQLDPNADLRRASLEAITSQLQSFARQENPNTATPSEALDQIAGELANLNASDRQAPVETLAQMAAQAAQSGDQVLAQALAAMSQSVLSGDSEATIRAAGQVNQAMDQSQSDLAVQSTLAQSLSQLQNISQSMAQAGQTGAQIASQKPGHGNNLGQGKTLGQGNTPGQGQSGQGQSGGGTKADTLPPGTGAGQAGRPEDMDTGAHAGDLGEEIFIPWDRRPNQGEQMVIPGKDTGQGETANRENLNPSGGQLGPALIPYKQVYTQYIEAAQQAINSSDIPTAYRDLVRDYFTNLEP